MLIPSILVKYYRHTGLQLHLNTSAADAITHPLLARACALLLLLMAPLAVFADPCRTAIHPAQVQGTGSSSPIVGQQVTARGVVTLVTPQIGGFFIQAEPNGHAQASDGLFIYAPEIQPSVGEHLAVTGEVKEFHGLTELTQIEQVQRCGPASLPEPIALGLEQKVSEALENMRVRLPETTILDNFQLLRVGELIVGTDKERWRLEDASNQRQITALPWGVPQDATWLANGNIVAPITGVLTWRWGRWVILPEHHLDIERQDWQRPAREPNTLRIASFNVENAFNGTAGSFQGSRGARNEAQWLTQRQKLVSALNHLDADLFVLQELQHDRGLPTPVLPELLQALDRHYEGLAPYRRPGDDAITNAIVYDPQRLRAVGPLTRIETHPRPALLQQFERLDRDERFSVVVVHMKSRGRNCVLLCKAERAEELALILEALEPLSATEPKILAGDFNTLPDESLWQPLLAEGWQRLNMAEPTYWFRGRAQQIDHFWVHGITPLPPAWGQPGHAEMPPMDFLHPLYQPERHWGASDHNPIIMHW